MWFPETVGTRYQRDEVTGYYVDLREAAKAPEWPPPWIRTRRLFVGVCQWGLGSFERHLAGDGAQWLDAAIAAGDHLLARQEKGGRFAGGWVHDFEYPHIYELRPPWLSGIAQGQGASLLVRLHLATGNERYAVGAQRALLPLTISTAQGGLLAHLDGGGFPEEFPTDPPSLVLNGGLYAILGQYDVAVGLNDTAAKAAFAESTETVASNLSRWDTGYWSRYDLYPHRVTPVASPWYHRLHVAQLDVFHTLTNRREYRDMARRFDAYSSSRVNATRAFAQKALFHAIVRRSIPRVRRRLGDGR
jgi:heparosan-N-sulfate-glucuronate 5-epimerase